MSMIDFLYSRLPIWSQQFAVSLYGWHWYRRRMGPHFHRLFTEYQSCENWTQEQFLAYQERRLSQVLQAANRSRYYQAIFRESKVDWQLPAFDILAGLPLLSKETLRTRAKDLLTQNSVPKIWWFLIKRNDWYSH